MYTKLFTKIKQNCLWELLALIPISVFTSSLIICVFISSNSHFFDDIKRIFLTFEILLCVIPFSPLIYFAGKSWGKVKSKRFKITTLGIYMFVVILVASNSKFYLGIHTAIFLAPVFVYGCFKSYTVSRLLEIKNPLLIFIIGLSAATAFPALILFIAGLGAAIFAPLSMEFSSYTDILFLIAITSGIYSFFAMAISVFINRKASKKAKEILPT